MAESGCSDRAKASFDLLFVCVSHVRVSHARTHSHAPTMGMPRSTWRTQNECARDVCVCARPWARPLKAASTLIVRISCIR